MNLFSSDNHATMLGRFRIIGIIEGYSFLILIGVGMPLKYLAGIPEPNKIIGYAHGFLFILYVVFLLLATIEIRWSFWTAAKLFIASLIPFGTFWTEKNILEKYNDSKN